MSLFVLETDILTLYREGHETVCKKVHACPTEELAITVITVEEQLSGWYALLRQVKKPHEVSHAYDRLGDSVRFLATWRILNYPEGTLNRFEKLKAMKLNVASQDLRIAAITLENNGILVTRNLRDFQRVPNLVVENWASEQSVPTV